MLTSLRWICMALTNPEPFGEVAMRLGFQPFAEPTIAVEGHTLHAFILDMGAGGFPSFLARLVGAELSSKKEEALDANLLDVDARELVLPSGRVGLTSLEFGVMRYLQERPGKAVARYDLMEAVWGYRNATASNVVDVVVRSLRRKLGEHAACVETVRGTGYRFRPRRESFG